MAPNVNESEVISSHSSTVRRGENNKKKDRKQKIDRLISKETPPFTVQTLKNAIPEHCFKPTLIESFSHLFKDLAEISLYVFLITYIDSKVESLPLRVLAWAIYTWMQGVVMTGVWVIAHECGHGAFSLSSTVNDTVGFILHTCLSVPYFAWQKTHASHHHYTNNLQKDEVFVPRQRSQVDTTSAYKTLPKNPFFTFIQLAFMLLLGWPLYLLLNTSGHKTESFASHFLPSSPIFSKKDYYKVIASNLGLVFWWSFLYYLGTIFGGSLVLRLYLLPLLVTNGFLVAITYMQHTHNDLPHYENEEWNWLRGALCTVDRTMGSYLDNKLHLIHVTHVLHHVFPRVPFYRSQEASDKLVKVLGKYHFKDDSNFLYAMWKNCEDCTFLEEGKGILFWLEENH